jgi:hypothetical protein
MSTTRRDFLRYAGLAAAVMSQSGLFAAATKSGPSPLLSVGYAPALPATSGRLASAPRSGSLSGDVRLTIRGGARAAQYRTLPGGVAIDVVYPNGRNCYFWSATRANGDLYGSLALHDGVSLSIKDLAAKTEAPLILGRTGVYVFALREGANDVAPDWNRLDLVREGNRFTVPGVNVSYAVLMVE